MDRRLVEAAQTGNVPALHILMKENPLLLRSAALVGGDTPLHIACIGGHVDFVKEVINLSPELSEELNRDGLSPLHIASGNGDVEIIRALLQVNSNLCTIMGKERRIPLHYAAIKGRVYAIRQLLSCCADSIMGVTARGETPMHLALKNNQFAAFKFLVEYLNQNQREDLLNNKDNQAFADFYKLNRTALQMQIVELVLDRTYFPEGTVDVNFLNKKGLTPLDVLLMEGGDNEIEEMLREAGAVKAEDLQPQQQVALSPNVVVTNETPPTNDRLRQGRTQSLSEQLQNYFKYDKLRDSPSEVRTTLLVLSVLIATATYQAVLSPPGGIWQDDYSPSNSTNNGTTYSRAHIAGQAVMGTNNMVSFGLFLIFNSIGFFMSLHMINFLTIGFPLQIELQVSIIALAATYDTCMTALTPVRSLSISYTIISVLLPIFITISTKVIRDNAKKARCTLRWVTTWSS
ncbi:hypothetical protein M9H77_33538 [Catharanthus roseus]|uniref:Uncharacterized protein n=1 Tax=Catharanthus roseus TaxID=4058 RepID=A0ACB9ZJF6_CATRO|nr:hypothetical protein M9H77_33538 [Catharanthus roseus]